MAWTAVENFNSYSDGDLNSSNGGTGWSGAWIANSSVDVQGSVVYEGAKACYFNSVADGVGAVRSLTTAVSSGTCSLRVRRPDKSAIFDIRLLDSSDNRLVYLRFGTADITLINNSETLVAGYSVDTWYLVEILIDVTGSGAHQVRIDGGSWSTAVNDYDGSAGDCSKILLESGGAGCNAYVDDIKPASAGPTEYTMTAGVGAFTLTGIDVGLGRAYTLIASVGSFILTGIDVALRKSGWDFQGKNSSTFANQTKIITTEEVESLHDSYTEDNTSSYEPVADGGAISVGQSFQGNGGVLSKCKFYLKRNSTPTGNVIARLYAHTGTYGTSSKPTGSALDSSSTIDIETIGTDADLYTFTFTGDYTLALGTNYVIAVEFTEGAYNFMGGDDYLAVGLDSSSSTHEGNASYTTNLSSWTVYGSVDLIFYVYTTTEEEVSPFTNQSKNSSSWTNQTK